MFVETRIISKTPPARETDRAVFRGESRVQAPEIVAAPQSTTLSMPTAVHRGDELIYLMSLATRVVVRYSILCSKFTKIVYRPGSAQTRWELLTG